MLIEFIGRNKVLLTTETKMEKEYLRTIEQAIQERRQILLGHKNQKGEIVYRELAKV